MWDKTNDMCNKDWLQNAPLKEEIKIKNGGKYIPYKIIVDKLNKLCGHNWSIKRFNETYVQLKGRILISGNVEIDVNYEYEGINVSRTISGGANFILTRNNNPHPTATVKSLCIMNAVKVLGETFGKSINEENENEENSVNQLPILKEEKQEVNKVRERYILLMNDCTTIEEVKEYETLSKDKTLLFNKEYKLKLKQVTDGN